jgi:hypothetical protein
MGVRRFIEGIENKINRNLSRDCEHIFEALFQGIIAGLPRAVIMGRVQEVKNVEVSPRLIAELVNEGGE